MSRSARSIRISTATSRSTATGQADEIILTHPDIHAHNTFGAPDTLTLGTSRAVAVSGVTFTHTFAPQSVTRLTIPLG